MYELIYLLEFRFGRRRLVVEVGDWFSLELEIFSKFFQGCFLFFLQKTLNLPFRFRKDCINYMDFYLLPLFKLVPFGFKRLVFLLKLLVILNHTNPTKK